MEEKQLISLLDKNKMPRHVAIIMDGNRRWAEGKGLSKREGHNAGKENLREIFKTCQELNIPFLTVYAFSTENWERNLKEVSFLLRLFENTLKEEREELCEKGIKFQVLGQIDGLPASLRKEIYESINATKHNQSFTFSVALNYGGRAEIINAVKKIVSDTEKGKVNIKRLDEDLFREYLYIGSLPDPDLVIRTSGESRISNFLLWQIAYSELYITSLLWPDFKKKDFIIAILDYQKRKRRLGKD